MLSYSSHSFQRLQSSFCQRVAPIPFTYSGSNSLGLLGNVWRPTWGLGSAEWSTARWERNWSGCPGVQTNSCTSATVQSRYAHKYTPSVWIRAALFVLHSNTRKRLSESLVQLLTVRFQICDFSKLQPLQSQRLYRWSLSAKYFLLSQNSCTCFNSLMHSHLLAMFTPPCVLIALTS